MYPCAIWEEDMVRDKFHFVGIGGIGMSGIAEVLVKMGYSVTGSDITLTDITKRLERYGVRIFQGHRAENIEGATSIIFSSAVSPSNPELMAAKAKGLPILKRAEILAKLMRLKRGVAIAGTHGKTTTTALLATILKENNLDPSYIIGGIVHNLDGHAMVGTGDYLVAEADESDGSFLLLNPAIAVITNIDTDHIDFYGSDDALDDAFLRFVQNIPSDGYCSFNIHDQRIKPLVKELSCSSINFGIRDDSSEPIDYAAGEITSKGFGLSFNFYYKGEKVTPIVLAIPGRHNVLNALGAISVAHLMGVDFERIKKSIMAFSGVQRRAQVLYQSKGFEIIDDYAHHPVEIRATLRSLKSTREKSKFIVIFEPHRFTRTQYCWENFLDCFDCVEKVYICPIYPASEPPIEGISSERLVDDVNKSHPGLADFIDYGRDFVEVIDLHKKREVTLVTLGAGNIGKEVRGWIKSNG